MRTRGSRSRGGGGEREEDSRGGVGGRPFLKFSFFFLPAHTTAHIVLFIQISNKKKRKETTKAGNPQREDPREERRIEALVLLLGRPTPYHGPTTEVSQNAEHTHTTHHTSGWQMIRVPKKKRLRNNTKGGTHNKVVIISNPIYLIIIIM